MYKINIIKNSQFTTSIKFLRAFLETLTMHLWLYQTRAAMWINAKTGRVHGETSC